jgi:integrase
VTCTGYRVIIHTFFSWCKSRGLSVENPVTDAMTFKVVPTAPGILSPVDAAKLLASCDPAILPGVVIGMFCGLRQSEISRLDWRNVDLASGIITVGADTAKTSSRRTVEIPENARQWLSPMKKDTGKVWPKNEEARNLWNLARIGAGFGPFFSTRAAVNEVQNDPETKKPRKDLREWPDNALRHSAISYRLAKTRDLPRVATEAGNSPAIIQRHYAELVKPDTAAKFFSIIPQVEGGKIIHMAGKAA